MPQKTVTRLDSRPKNAAELWMKLASRGYNMTTYRLEEGSLHEGFLDHETEDAMSVGMAYINSLTPGAEKPKKPGRPRKVVSA